MPKKKEKKSLLDKWEDKLGKSLFATFIFNLFFILAILAIIAVIVGHIILFVHYIVFVPFGNVPIWKTVLTAAFFIVEGAVGLTVYTWDDLKVYAEAEERRKRCEDKAD